MSRPSQVARGRFADAACAGAATEDSRKLTCNTYSQPSPFQDQHGIPRPKSWRTLGT